MLEGFGLLALIFLTIVLVILLCAVFKINPFISLILCSLFLGIGAGIPLLEVIDAIQSGFGGIMKYIGLVVVLGSVIGVFLERSGGALRIAQAIVSLSGKNRSVAAMSLIGAVISIPVFCDSGFILLSGLTKRMATLAKKNKAVLSLALATGLYTTHTLVPPTPGPIAAAGNIGASDYLGTIMLVGMAVSIPVLLLSQFLARRLGENIVLEEVADAEEESNQQLPTLLAALSPLLVPIILIGLGTLLKFLGVENRVFQFLGDPLIAIFIGALLAMIFLRPSEENGWQHNLTEAIKVAGPILIITGAGGAFGGVLKATKLADTVGDWLGTGMSSEVLVLILVWVIAAVLKTAQGSSTSAMVISSSLLAPLVPVLGWDSPIDFALAILAIGGGAMTMSHYNDSYFWVVSQFGGIQQQKTFSSFSIITAVMGFIILIIAILLSLVV